MTVFKWVCVLSMTGFWLLGCSPSQTPGVTSGVGSNERADQASFNALAGANWCFPADVNQNFFLSWKFQDDGVAFFSKTDSKTGIILFKQKKSWKMRSKILSVYEFQTTVELLKKQIGFALDLQTGNQTMTWTDVANSNCAGSQCSSTSTEAMTLTKCE